MIRGSLRDVQSVLPYKEVNAQPKRGTNQREFKLFNLKFLKLNLSSLNGMKFPAATFAVYENMKQLKHIL